jgi:hypothetical protein
MTFNEMLPDLYELVSPTGAMPDSPLEAEEFFTQLVAQFSDRASLRQHVATHVPQWFRSLRQPPDWIQNPEWLWEGGKPMVFVGSIDAPRGTFHDDARFYVFWSPGIGTTKCVIQVA